MRIYINKMGGIPFFKLSRLAKQIGAHSFYLDADFEYRRLEPETEYSLSHSAFFQQIVNSFGMPEIDLFVTITNAECKSYVSWIRDLGSMVIDAFT